MVNKLLVTKKVVPFKFLPEIRKLRVVINQGQPLFPTHFAECAWGVSRLHRSQVINFKGTRWKVSKSDAILCLNNCLQPFECKQWVKKSFYKAPRGKMHLVKWGLHATKKNSVSKEFWQILLWAFGNLKKIVFWKGWLREGARFDLWVIRQEQHEEFFL